MKQYHEIFIQKANQFIDFSDKNVLEVGCGNGEVLKEIANKNKPKMITGIDYKMESQQFQQGENWKIEQGDITDLQYPDSFFDIVISVASFEHICDINKALFQIKRVLKPYGKFFTMFGPIWTSIVGHHYLFYEESWAKLIPPWGHLWMKEDEMLAYLEPLVGNESAQVACTRIYRSSGINRVSRKEYYEAVFNCGLWVKYIQEHISLSRLSCFGIKDSEFNEEIYSKLRNKYQRNDLSVFGFTFLLEKFAKI